MGTRTEITSPYLRPSGLDDLEESFSDNNFFSIIASHNSISITAAEIALEQISGIQKVISNEIIENGFVSDLASNIKEDDRFFKSVEMIKWTWGRALKLLYNFHLSNPNATFNVDIITNDFLIPPDLRAVCRSTVYKFFPKSLKDIAEKVGFKFIENQDSFTLVLEDLKIKGEFIFESALRNSAKRLKKKLLNDAVIISEEEVCVIIRSEKSSIITDDQFQVHTGDALRLYNKKEVPVCNSIILQHFLKRKDSAIVNVADYEWKCGYRGGALAIYNLFDFDKPIVNILYTLPLKNAFYCDIFNPKVNSHVS